VYTLDELKALGQIFAARTATAEDLVASNPQPFVETMVSLIAAGTLAAGDAERFRLAIAAYDRLGSTHQENSEKEEINREEQQPTREHRIITRGRAEPC
jgi:hypothetical protein